VLDRAGLAYKAEWVVGEVAQSVAEHAKTVGADLIVMGSHGHGALMSIALGSTATKILAACKVPVLIVR
jgi:nucleotide-binding universal stress UspA family protein